MSLIPCTLSLRASMTGHPTRTGFPQGTPQMDGETQTLTSIQENIDRIPDILPPITGGILETPEDSVTRGIIRETPGITNGILGIIEGLLPQGTEKGI